MLRGLVLAGACAWAVVALAAVVRDATAWPMLPVAALVLAGTVFERARYWGDRPGPAPGPTSAWRETGERFLDEATGAPVTVWFDPVSGARRYVPAGEGPPKV